jgi:hypothetical protein
MTASLPSSYCLKSRPAASLPLRQLSLHDYILIDFVLLYVKRATRKPQFSQNKALNWSYVWCEVCNLIWSWTSSVYVGFEVLTAVVMKNSTLWDIMERSSLKVNRCFGGTCRLLLQSRRSSQGRNQHGKLAFYVWELVNRPQIKVKQL